MNFFLKKRKYDKNAEKETKCKQTFSTFGSSDIMQIINERYKTKANRKF